MSLNASNFLAVQADFEAQEFKRELSLFNALANSKLSRQLTQLAKDMAPAGSGFVTSLTMPLFVNSSTTATTSSLAGAFPGTAENPDLTNAYQPLTDQAITVSINRYTYGQFQVPDAHKWNHSMGPMLAGIGIREYVQKCRQDVEDAFFTMAYASGTYFSGTGGTGVDHTLDTTSTTNIQAGFAKLTKTANAQNWQGDRLLVLNKEVEGVLLANGGADFRPLGYVSTTAGGGAGDVVAGNAWQYQGFKLLFSNAAVSGEGIALSPDRAALILPTGFQVEQLRPYVGWADYYRLRLPFAPAIMGKRVASYVSASITGEAQKEGILRVTVV